MRSRHNLSFLLQSSFAGFAVAAFASAGASDPGEPTPGVAACWAEFEANLETCSGINDPTLRANCFSTVNDALGHCLAGLDPEQKPANCLAVYFHFLLNKCSQNDVCQTTECREACANGAQLFFNWCAAVDEEGFEAGGAIPQWQPVPEVLGKWELQYDFTVVTNGLGVDGVSFWVVHRTDAADDGQRMAYRLGGAELLGEFGSRRVWYINGHRGVWEGIGELVPIGSQDRLILIAFAEKDGQPVAVSHVMASIE